MGNILKITTGKTILKINKYTNKKTRNEVMDIFFTDGTKLQIRSAMVTSKIAVLLAEHKGV